MLLKATALVKQYCTKKIAMANVNNTDCLGFLPLFKMKHFLNQAFVFFFFPPTESSASTFFHLVLIWT